MKSGTYRPRRAPWLRCIYRLRFMLRPRRAPWLRRATALVAAGRAVGLAAGLAIGLAGCNDSGGDAATTTVYAGRVLDYSPVTTGVTGGIYDESKILAAPDGSTEVTSLGFEISASPAAVGGSITVGLGESSAPYCLEDGDGDDLVIYENVFATTDSSGTVNFTEAAFVEVSEDNTTFYRFSATYPAADAALVGDPGSYGGMAGISVGGDGFDLADVIAAHGLAGDFSPCYVRIVDGGTLVPDYDSDGELSDATTQNGSGADIDAVEGVFAVSTPGLSP